MKYEQLILKVYQRNLQIQSHIFTSLWGSLIIASVVTKTGRRGLVTHTCPSLSMDVLAKEEREAVNERSEYFHSFYFSLLLRPAVWLTQPLASQIMEEVGEEWD